MLSRPWRARLFFPSRPGPIASVPFERNEVGGVSDLLDGCRVLREGYEEDVILYFRGEGRFSWKLRPSVMRSSGNGAFAFRAAEAEMLNDLMTRQPDAFDNVGSGLGQWVFAQHHELKTRLLDITRNPLVALFNACVDNDPEDGKLHVFAVPRSLIKPFNSDTVRVISNFAKLSRGEQNLLLGKTKADASDDVFPDEADNFFKCREMFSRAMARLYSIKGFSLCFRSHQMLIVLLRSRHGFGTVPGDVRELLDLGKLVSIAVRQAGGPVFGSN